MNPEKRRKYLHFDLPISRAQVVEIASRLSPDKAESFYPFVRFSNQERTLTYAAHRDSAVFSLVAVDLAKRYEKRARAAGILDSVIANRVHQGADHIALAKQVFDEIGERQKCVVYVFDIEKFFSCIDHKLLKKRWKRLRKVDSLSKLDFSVFKAHTEYSYVKRTKLSKEMKRADLKPSRHRICKPLEFRNVVRGGGLIRRNKKAMGIPQGSPLSGVLSNIFMMPFDRALSAKAEELGGLYRRYCDDIVFVTDQKEDIPSFVEKQLEKTLLSCQEDKTQAVKFSQGGTNQSIQFLGFEFNGSQVQIRKSTLEAHCCKHGEYTSSFLGYAIHAKEVFGSQFVTED